MIYDFLILDSGRTGLARGLPPLTPPILMIYANIS